MRALQEREKKPREEAKKEYTTNVYILKFKPIIILVYYKHENFSKRDRSNSRFF